MTRGVQAFYEQNYAAQGINAQRRYPNEALIRFVSGSLAKHAGAKVLEVGCGSGANLWMLVKEGFAAYGIDFSPSAVSLCQKAVEPYGTADLRVGNMLKTGYDADFFDAVCDVLSGCFFTHHDYCCFLREVSRICKPGGLFFFYTPCTTSRAFIDHAPSKMLDPYTLDGIKRKDSPYYGNNYPIHFLDADRADEFLDKAGFARVSLERVTRTYNNLSEPFSCLAGVYRKE